MENKLSSYELLSAERKRLQKEGELPMWLTTMGWQMVKNKGYLWGSLSLKDVFHRMADTAAKHLKPEHKEYYNRRFFEVLWDGHLGGSTPTYNLGTPKGFPISCTGNRIGDEVFEFYNSNLEVATLTQEGFGTSSYMGDIRGRGSLISRGGTAQGLVPVFNSHVNVMSDVSQGNARRGSWCGYIPIMHPDFDELIDDIFSSPDDKNVGFNYYDVDMINLFNNDPEMVRRYQRHMKLRDLHGKGYFYFPDRVHRLQPLMYIDKGLKSEASNLCNEITLFADNDHSFTCVLSSVNLAKYDEWKDTDLIEVSTIFLDCVVSEFLELIDKKEDKIKYKAMQRVYNSTIKGRALGLGVMGFATLLQEKMIPYESEECIDLNEEIFSKINRESLKASQWLAKEYGEPEWCVGYGVRNTHRISLPPTMSSSSICGTVSQSIEPIYSNTFEQKLAGGTVTRINPTLMKLMTEKGVFSQEWIDDIGMNHDGSVQHVPELTDHEKAVFKTQDEIDQRVIIYLAAERQKHICQSQSLNLAFGVNATEEEISDVTLEAVANPWCKGLYYMRRKAANKGSTGKKTEVTIKVCEGCSA